MNSTALDGQKDTRLIPDGWKCSTCSAAMNRFSEPASLGVMLSLALVCITMWNFVRR